MAPLDSPGVAGSEPEGSFEDAAIAGLAAAFDSRGAFAARVPGSSVEAVHRTARFDGRTRVVAARTPGGSWQRAPKGLRFSRDEAGRLRAAGFSEVVLKRGRHRASFPLQWLSRRDVG